MLKHARNNASDLLKRKLFLEVNLIKSKPKAYLTVENGRTGESSLQKRQKSDTLIGQFSKENISKMVKVINKLPTSYENSLLKASLALIS